MEAEKERPVFDPEQTRANDALAKASSGAAGGQKESQSKVQGQSKYQKAPLHVQLDPPTPVSPV